MRTILILTGKPRSSASQPVCPLERVVAGSSVESVAVLYGEHHGWLKGWLRKKLGCSDAAADLAQDTFVRIINARNAHEIKEPRAYLTTIARSLMINQFRRNEIEQAYLFALQDRQEAFVQSVEDRAIVIETLMEIDAMLDKLPTNVRRAFLLFQLEGLKHAEIAECMGVSVSSVRQYIMKAVQHCLLFRG